MIRKIRDDFRAMFSTIKSPETEEVFDIYFSRFFGYYFALLSKAVSLTPNQVSLLSLFVGMVAGVFFFFQNEPELVLVGCFLITVAGLLDSADGQLARMTGMASELGRKIDVIIDTFVFVACYAGGALYFVDEYGLWIFPLAIAAGWCHSIKSGVYEYYKTEFLYYKYRTIDYRIPHLDEVVPDMTLKSFWRKLLFNLEKDYIGKQAFFKGRKRLDRNQFEKWSQSNSGDQFFEIYRKDHLRMLTWWAIVGGTNVHRTALMIFSLFGHMDYYFWFSIVTFIPMFIIRYFQLKQDQMTLHNVQLK